MALQPGRPCALHVRAASLAEHGYETGIAIVYRDFWEVVIGNREYHSDQSLM